MAEKPIPRVVARAVVLHQGHVLFLRSQEPGRVFFFLPGGHVAHGERLEAAVVREVLEETSIHVQVVRPLAVREFIAARHKRRAANMPPSHHVLGVIFLCRLDPQRYENCTLEQIGGFVGDAGVPGVSGMEWLSLADVPRREIHPPQIKEALAAPFPDTGLGVLFWGEDA